MRIPLQSCEAISAVGVERVAVGLQLKAAVLGGIKMASVSAKPSGDPAAQSRSTAAAPPVPTPVFEERHYTIAEIAGMWKVSKDAVRRLFQLEPGVLALGNSHPRGKRRYTTLRIPQSVLGRVHLKYSLSR